MNDIPKTPEARLAKTISDGIARVENNCLGGQQTALQLLTVISMRVIELEKKVDMLMDLHRVEDDQPRLPFNGEN